MSLQQLKVSDKECPKAAFLGLCENGNVIGVPSGTYMRSNAINKQRAIDIRNIIMNKNPPALPTVMKKNVWKQVTSPTKADEGVINVVYGLFNGGVLQ